MQANTLVIITGIAGSGKSTALKAFEDMGFFCVDNLPAPLIPQFIDFLLNIPPNWLGGSDWSVPSLWDQPAGHPGMLPAESLAKSTEVSVVREESKALAEQIDKVSGSQSQLGAVGGGLWRFALLADCRDESSFRDVATAIEKLRSVGTSVSLLFFDCSDDIIVHRFRETRRPHPLLLSKPSIRTVQDAITAERSALASFRGLASRIVDTSGLSPHELRRVVEGIFEHQASLEITLVSFGFKYGAPVDVDLIVDVRFLPNPHFVPELRPLIGTQSKVQEFVLENQDAKEFLSRYLSLLEFLLPRYTSEGKRYLTIGVGCTGGKHRSVAVAISLGRALAERGFRNDVRHRDSSR